MYSLGLKKILDQVKYKVITEQHAINGIESYDKAINLAQDRAMLNVSNKLAVHNGTEYHMSSEDQILEQEYEDFMADLMQEINDFLGDRTFNNLVDWALSGQTFRQIAEIERTSFQAVQQRVSINTARLAEYLDNKYGKEKLLSMRPPSRSLPTAVATPWKDKRIVLPFEQSRRSYEYVEIVRNKHNVPSYKFVEVCNVLKDLDKAFGDNLTVCSYCKKCKTRKGKR